jgi:hypothetical protein
VDDATTGFGDATPQPPAREDVIWALTKNYHRAHAAVRRLGHGDELRIYLDDQLVISYLHRHGALDALQAQSAQHLESFKELGWQQVRT